MKVQSIGDFYIASRADGDTIVAHCGSKTEREVLEYLFESGKPVAKAAVLYRACFVEGPPSSTTAIWIHSDGYYDAIVRDDPEAAIIRISKFGKLFESTMYTSGTLPENFAIGIAVHPAIRERLSDVEVTRYTTADELASMIGAEDVCLISE